MPDILGTVVLQVITMTLTGIIGWLGGKIRGAATERERRNVEEVRERDENRAVMRLLLYYRLKDLYTTYVVEQNPITSADKHEIEEIYNFYHSRGGNGEGTRMYHALIDIQTVG